MSDTYEPADTTQQGPPTLSHRRILVEMAAVTLVAGVVGFIVVSGRFFFGVLFGGALALVNYLWLKRSTRWIFEAVADGDRPRFLGVRYFLRYVGIGAVLLVVYLTDAVPVVAVIAGLGSFAVAVVIEGLFNIFSGFFKKGL